MAVETVDGGRLTYMNGTLDIFKEEDIASKYPGGHAEQLGVRLVTIMVVYSIVST